MRRIGQTQTLYIDRLANAISHLLPLAALSPTLSHGMAFMYVYFELGFCPDSIWTFHLSDKMCITMYSRLYDYVLTQCQHQIFTPLWNWCVLKSNTFHYVRAQFWPNTWIILAEFCQNGLKHGFSASPRVAVLVSYLRLACLCPCSSSQSCCVWRYSQHLCWVLPKLLLKSILPSMHQKYDSCIKISLVVVSSLIAELKNLQIMPIAAMAHWDRQAQPGTSLSCAFPLWKK